VPAPSSRYRRVGWRTGWLCSASSSRRRGAPRHSGRRLTALLRTRRRRASLRRAPPRPQRRQRRFLDICGEERLLLAVERVHYFAHWVTPRGTTALRHPLLRAAARPTDAGARRRRGHRRDLALAEGGIAAAPRGPDRPHLPDHPQLQAIARSSARPTCSTRAAAAGHVPSSNHAWWLTAGPCASVAGTRYDEAVAARPGSGGDFKRAIRIISAAGEPGRRGRLSRWAAHRPCCPTSGRPTDRARVPVELAPGVVRVSARILDDDRPGHQYLPRGARSVTVIDPGPAGLPAHTHALVAAAGVRCHRRIVVTHTHPDHATGCGRLGGGDRRRGDRYGPAEGFEPDALAAEGAASRWATTPCWDATRRATHRTTCAGCSSRAACLFTGDHVMEGSTVVIRPPTGHGRLLGQPRAPGGRLRADQCHRAAGTAE